MEGAGFHVILNETGSIITDNGKVLVQRIEDEQLVYVDRQSIQQYFDLGDYGETNINKNSNLEETQTDYDTNASVDISDRERVPWSRNEILQLVNLYKRFQTSFKSTTIKNDKVWHMIAQELSSHTAEQCKNKFKYLKQRYMEKKDNMKSKSTGARAITFQYFDVFEDIFSNDPNVAPVATASSSKGKLNIHSKIISTETENLPPELHESSSENQCNIKYPNKKRKISELQRQLKQHEDNLEKKEEERERRHKERLERQAEATNVLKSIAESFAKIVNNSYP